MYKHSNASSALLLFLFQAHMKFPPDYPYSPPSIRFMTKVWHPNVYEVSKYTNYRSPSFGPTTFPATLVLSLSTLQAVAEYSSLGNPLLSLSFTCSFHFLRCSLSLHPIREASALFLAGPCKISALNFS